MNPPILNREFQHPADAWYHIEPKGQHPNQAAGVVQVIDDEAVAAIVNRFNADAAAGQLRHGQELLIDHEHFSDQADQESRAYGWLTKLENRADGIYGQVRWTKTGKEAVDGGDYRFFSTEYDPADLKVLNADGRLPTADLKPVRPLRLAGLTLTNMHNNRGQKPITNRAAPAAPLPQSAIGHRPSAMPSPSPGTSPDSQPTQNQKPNMKSIAAELGLSPEAAEEAVLGEVRKLKQRLAALEPNEAENTTLKNRLTALEAEQVDGLLATHGVKEEKLVNRLKPVLAGMKNREERVAALVDFGFKPAEAARSAALPASGRVLNRGEGKPAAAPAAAHPDAQNAQVRLIQNREKCDFRRAWDMARVEKPELFA